MRSRAEPSGGVLQNFGERCFGDRDRQSARSFNALEHANILDNDDWQGFACRDLGRPETGPYRGRHVSTDRVPAWQDSSSEVRLAAVQTMTALEMEPGDEEAFGSLHRGGSRKFTVYPFCCRPETWKHSLKPAHAQAAQVNRGMWINALSDPDVDVRIQAACAAERAWA